MTPTSPTTQLVEAVPTDGLFSSVGPFDYALLAAGLAITVILLVGFVILLRRMGREPN